MRYIRTKDGEIYDTIEDEKIRLERNDKTHEIIFLLLPNTNTFNMPICLNVIDQADTIEELCDEFVLKATINEQVEYLYDEILKIIEICKIAHEGTGHSCEVYGAIWVAGKEGEPILKSVAKMNEEGELKLL